MDVVSILGAESWGTQWQGKKKKRVELRQLNNKIINNNKIIK